jgi:copper chaperone CopZ
MDKLVFDVPALYGDHHVSEARRILLELPGVSDVYASSAFHSIEVTYDLSQVNPETIQASLRETGYLDELPMPTETGVAVSAEHGSEFFRHTTTYEQTRQIVGFAQRVTYTGRPLWYCPGMGVIEKTENGGNNG